MLPFSQNAMLPAGMRQRDQTKKSPTGPYDRDALMQHLEKVALEHKDREDLVPFTGEKKGDGRSHVPGKMETFHQRTSEGRRVWSLNPGGSIRSRPGSSDSLLFFLQEKPSWQRNQQRFRSTSR